MPSVWRRQVVCWTALSLACCQLATSAGRSAALVSETTSCSRQVVRDMTPQLAVHGAIGCERSSRRVSTAMFAEQEPAGIPLQLCGDPVQAGDQVACVD